MKPNIKCTWIAVIAAVAVSLALGTALRAAPLPGAIFTTDSTCSGVDLNIYGDKHEVYLDGGPSHPGAASLPDGSYYVQVTDPSGACVLGTSIGAADETPFHVSGNGTNIPCIQLCSVLINTALDPTCAGGGVTDPNCGYNDTANPGGEYKVWVSTESSFTNNTTKTDNFKVRAGGGTNPATLCVRKFYDKNANGIWDANESEITGWAFTLFATVGFDTVQIPVTTTPWCGTVDPDTYTATEGTPIETNWVHTTPQVANITLVAGQSGEIDFGNVCLGAGGGLTLGFWSNRNGQGLETGGDFCFLNSLNLVKGNNGAVYDPIVNTNCPNPTTQQVSAARTSFSSWLTSASATNMAYMLSAQLAAMELNTRHNPNPFGGGVNGSALVYAPCLLNYAPITGLSPLGFISINDLMTAANTELGLHNITLAGSPFRAYQECLKTTLDNANNNLNFVESSPCPFTFPTQ
jgi:hypothetical protein